MVVEIGSNLLAAVAILGFSYVIGKMYEVYHVVKHEAVKGDDVVA